MFGNDIPTARIGDHFTALELLGTGVSVGSLLQRFDELQKHEDDVLLAQLLVRSVAPDLWTDIPAFDPRKSSGDADIPAPVVEGPVRTIAVYRTTSPDGPFDAKDLLDDASVPRQNIAPGIYFVVSDQTTVEKILTRRPDGVKLLVADLRYLRWQGNHWLDTIYEYQQ